jgi:hypothetical protein
MFPVKHQDEPEVRRCGHCGGVNDSGGGNRWCKACKRKDMRRRRAAEKALMDALIARAGLTQREWSLLRAMGTRADKRGEHENVS